MEGVFLFGCPLTGEVVPISQCSDPTFAQGMLGPGAVIRPAGCQVLAPADATVEFTLSTKHALGLVTLEGIKFLIHVGMDTNKLEGQGFRLFVQTGDQVKRGDKLLEFDPQVMAEHHCNLDTPPGLLQLRHWLEGGAFKNRTPPRGGGPPPADGVPHPPAGPLSCSHHTGRSLGKSRQRPCFFPWEVV